MNILLHTIALEPARWTPQRVSQSLPTLLANIAGAGFHEIEIFEPHLGETPSSPEIREALAAHDLKPVILSSYLDLNPARTPDADLDAKIDIMSERINFYGFSKVRIFPGSKMNPADEDGVRAFAARLRKLAARMEGLEILLETHDGSLADDPEVLVRIVEEMRDLGCANVGLLFQPTVFGDADSIRYQFQIQKPHIRHLHLQNRKPDLSFETMKDGVVPWPEILRELAGTVDATLEFVPTGICSVGEFNLDATIAEALSEVEFVRGLAIEREA